ncbi:hypothetical protein ACWKWU_17715 [Chitinophaga lutea]
MEELVVSYGLAYIGVAAVLFLLFRRFMFAVFDPMIFIILMLASCIALSIDSSILSYVLGAVFCFWLGMMTAGKPRRNFTPIYEFTNIPALEVFINAFFFVYIFVNFMLYKDAGIPLFSDNASESKVAIFTEGTGWIRRIIFFSNILPIGLFLLIIVSRKKLYYTLMLFVYLSISVLLGSKGGLLGILFIAWFYYSQTNLWNRGNLRIRKMIKSNAKYLILISLGIFGAIVAKEAVLEGDHFVYSIGFRLMEFGDAMLYYKVDAVRDYFKDYGLADFIQFELNGILGMLRIVPYTEPIGYQMVKAYWGEAGEVITGPNGLFLVRGHIFFGYVGGLIYSYLIGFGYAFARKAILGIRIKDVFIYALAVFTLFNMDGMVREFSQFVSTYFDFLVYNSPLLLLVAVVYVGMHKRAASMDNRSMESNVK